MTTHYKPMADYLGLPWTYSVDWSEDPIDPWTVRIKELPGCMTHGKTASLAMANAVEAVESYVASLMEAGEPVPEPIRPDEYKGVITVRTTPDKHYKLAKVARRYNKSVNKLLDEAIDQVIEDAG